MDRKPHKHAELIKAWADGAEIEMYSDIMKEWVFIISPSWCADMEYRIKPEPKPDFVYCACFDFDALDEHKIMMTDLTIHNDNYFSYPYNHNLKLTFDGETGKLKSAEVINND